MFGIMAKANVHIFALSIISPDSLLLSLFRFRPSHSASE
jgi:hypothetical protein